VQRLSDGQSYALKEMDVKGMSVAEKQDAANEVRPGQSRAQLWGCLPEMLGRRITGTAGPCRTGGMQVSVRGAAAAGRRRRPRRSRLALCMQGPVRLSMCREGGSA
jgi:hypothetical protein